MAVLDLKCISLFRGLNSLLFKICYFRGMYSVNNLRRNVLLNNQQTQAINIFKAQFSRFLCWSWCYIYINRLCNKQVQTWHHWERAKKNIPLVSETLKLCITSSQQHSKDNNSCYIQKLSQREKPNIQTIDRRPDHDS